MERDSPTCASCAAPLAADQSYCLSCGARLGDASPLLTRLLEAHAAQGAAWPAASDASPRASARPARPARAPGLLLPRPRLSALLVAGFLGFGMLLGSAAGSTSSTPSPSSRGHLKLVFRSVPSVARNVVTRPNPGAAERRPPAIEEQPTPEPARDPASTSTSVAKPGALKRSARAGASESPPTGLPHIRHVFLIVLSDQPYAATFGPESKSTYLAHALESKGELLVRYDAVAHEELANGIALLSGQGPTSQTALNCPRYSDLLTRGVGAAEQVLGEGCVYPRKTQTLPGQLTERHLKWRAYVQGSDEPGSVAGACSHPALGAADPTSEQAQPTGAYATFRNPLLYFHSIIDAPACAGENVGLGRLKADLAHASSAPSLAYIVPDRCHDGNPTPCVAGAPAGPAAADSLLRKVVPEIMASGAYRHGGLIAITVDEAPSGGEFGDSSSCCAQPTFPNLASLGAPGGAARGGGVVGALLLSPFVKASSTSQEPYNHFSLLRTIEDIFKVPHLGYAASPGVKSFAPSLFAEQPVR